jgi:AraC-like DNA-binding protein
LNAFHPASASSAHACAACLRATPTGRQRHGRGEVLGRHLHRHAFAALVLSGVYCEAGDSGLHHVAPGDVLLHGAHERHLDRFGHRGSDVLVLPLPDTWQGSAHARIADPDRIARLAERDVAAAVAELQRALVATAPANDDWPALLARDLLDDPDLSLRHWGDTHGLHVGSISRGFRRVFELSPSAFRLHARSHAALRLVRNTTMTGASIAQACGFADQAHMSRALRAMTGLPPSQLRPHRASQPKPNRSAQA